MSWCDRSCRVVAEVDFGEFNEPVEGDHVELLNSIGCASGEDGGDIAQGGERTTIAAEEANHGDAFCFGGFGGEDEVLGVTRGAEADQDVAGLTEGKDGAGENVLEAKIVGDTGDVGAVRQGDRGEGWPIVTEAAGEFFAEMVGVAQASSVATCKQRISICEGFIDGGGSGIQTP